MSFSARDIARVSTPRTDPAHALSLRASHSPSPTRSFCLLQLTLHHAPCVTDCTSKRPPLLQVADGAGCLKAVGCLPRATAVLLTELLLRLRAPRPNPTTCGTPRRRPRRHRALTRALRLARERALRRELAASTALPALCVGLGRMRSAGARAPRARGGAAARRLVAQRADARVRAVWGACRRAERGQGRAPGRDTLAQVARGHGRAWRGRTGSRALGRWGRGRALGCRRVPRRGGRAARGAAADAAA